MTLVARDHRYLGSVTNDELAALILELASQLHVERQRRIALETVLERAGLVQIGALDRLADDAEVGDKGRSALDQAVCRLLRIVTESGEPSAPLRSRERS